VRSPVAAYEATSVFPYFLSAQGDVCAAGTYCGIGSSSQTNCPGGYFCPDKHSSNYDSTNTCSAGFYCQANAEEPTPGGPWAEDNGATPIGGDICPKGKYCAG
jgi:hypothetical protein